MLVEGKARVGAGEADFGELGDRMDVFEGKPPHSRLRAGRLPWSATATTPCTLAVCTAPAGPAGRRR